MESGEVDPTRSASYPGARSAGSGSWWVRCSTKSRTATETRFSSGTAGALFPRRASVPPDVRALVSEISDLLLAADAGSLDAETQLYGRYCSDPRLHPGNEVTQFSPFGDPPVHVALRA